jgi:protein-tyrosine phosphatase
MARVAFVCLGNICRSPIAAAVMRSLVLDAGLAHEVQVESAGTAGYHEGEGADPRTVAALERHGYPSDHVARRFRAQDFDRIDLVLALDRQNHRDLRRLAPSPEAEARVHLLRSFDPGGPADLDVPDPWYGGDADFDATVAMVLPACEGLLDHLRAQVR